MEEPLLRIPFKSALERRLGPYAFAQLRHGMDMDDARLEKYLNGCDAATRYEQWVNWPHEMLAEALNKHGERFMAEYKIELCLFLALKRAFDARRCARQLAQMRTLMDLSVVLIFTALLLSLHFHGTALAAVSALCSILTFLFLWATVYVQRVRPFEMSAWHGVFSCASVATSVCLALATLVTVLFVQL